MSGRKRLAALILAALLAGGCACHNSWLRSCGPQREGWSVSDTILAGRMVVTIERLPPGRYEVTARRNWQGREEILARGEITVSRRPSTRAEITLAPLTGEPMPRDAFAVVQRLDRPEA